MIRTACDKDIPALEALIDTLGYSKDPGYFPRCLSENRDIYIVSSPDGSDAGYVMLNRAPRYAMFRKLGIPEIQDLNVLHAQRRQGLATALIAHCEERARAQGYSRIGIGVALFKDYGPAQRLYVKLGYMPDGYGITYDRESVTAFRAYAVDDDLCLMMVKDLG